MNDSKKNSIQITVWMDYHSPFFMNLFIHFWLIDLPSTTILMPLLHCKWWKFSHFYFVFLFSLANMFEFSNFPSTFCIDIGIVAMQLNNGGNRKIKKKNTFYACLNLNWDVSINFTLNCFSTFSIWLFDMLGTFFCPFDFIQLNHVMSCKIKSLFIENRN